MGESFWQKESLLQYSMTLLQGPKDPVLPTLNYKCHKRFQKGPFLFLLRPCIYTWVNEKVIIHKP
jgi:hypothetical protein